MSLSPATFTDIYKLYDIQSDKLINLNGYYSNVFEIENQVIKVKSKDQTDFTRLNSEITWLTHLKDSGISIAYPVKNTKGNYIDLIDEKFFVISYAKAQGISPRKFYSKEKWYPHDFLENWGSYVGKLHSISRSFPIPLKTFSRPTWQESIDFFDLESYPTSQKNVVNQFNNVVKEVERLPKSNNNYGLIHNDLLEDNMHIYEDKITAFDFEDSCFNWYVNDIAIAMFYPVFFGISDTIQQKEYGDFFLTYFMRGYRKENNISAKDLETIPLFLKIREMDNYSMYYSDPKSMKHKVVSDFMDNRQHRIEQNIPVLDIDFSKY